MEPFEKRYDGLTVEESMQRFWEENHIYDFAADDTKPLYSIDTPPPTISGSLHIGHIFSYTQAEMIARYRRMQGYHVFYPFGFDDNGLPSERLVEKETGLMARDVPREEFRQKCVEITQKYEAEFKALWQRMGFSCDWNLQYSTVSENTQRLSQTSFIELAQAGHAYLQESPVLWCTECQTSIAQAELDSKDVDSYFHHIHFHIGDQPLEIATTRPEMLYGVVCVFVNPDDARYRHLVGQMVTVPLYGFEVPLLTDDKVAIDKGTGAVMCATFGDSTDVEWVAGHGLPYKKVLLADGAIAPGVPFVAGMKVRAARKEIVRLLEERGLLLKSEKLTHTVSVHERCGTEVEIIPSRQWYIDVLSRKDELLAAGDKIQWHPPQMKTRYVNWVTNLKWDWCISRQRYFGIPIPVWYCKACGKPAYAALEQLPVNPLETDYDGICACGCHDFLPDKAVLDTWATSSITPLLNRDKAKEYGVDEGFMPMSMRTQAHEIIRTWAFYTIAKSLYHTNEIPWFDTMICGFVLAKPGEKISKSKSNSKLSPGELIQSYSADAIRYWAANARLGTDTYFDIQDMQDTSKRFMTKLWNSSKFVLSHLHDFDPAHRPERLLPIDRWIMERTNAAVLEAAKWLDEYEVGLARKVVDDLFWKDLCDNYIEIAKERLYQPDLHGEEPRRAAQHAIYYCLLTVLKMYAIYIPHEVEYIYQKGLRGFVGALSIHLTEWPKPPAPNAELLAFGETLIAALTEVRRYKAERNLSMRADIDRAVIAGDAKYRDWLLETEKDFVACTHAGEVIYDLK
ncbi:MAG: valine--tRNA ligase [Oscillospiraceae bacterium]|jgi:valyl-tRNA synthetase|nr:valine--tRNA ligase [Oscillospiraceae bacterium]